MKHLYIILTILPVVFLSSCEKYLEVKPDKKQAVPSTLRDVQALLDNSFAMQTYSPMLDMSSDDYYMSDKDWATLTVKNREIYLWENTEPVEGNWNNPYETVFYANLALETLDKDHSATAEQLRGAAFFFRGYSLYFLAQTFAKTYDAATASSDPGIPLRLKADFNGKSARASVEQTYRQIISDFREAASRLPLQTPIAIRPNKAAAYAALARTYLVMEDYSNAALYADSSLTVYNTLLDYNNLSSSAANPISQLNAEVIYQSASGGAASLATAKCKVDSGLYRLYAANDRRRQIYFAPNSDGTHKFKGSYNGTAGSTVFNGITTSEVYLVLAESQARTGDAPTAMNTLNKLLEKRYEKASFTPFSATDSEDALEIILKERRKELVLRSLRWTDLRRLNKDTRFAKTLYRRINGQVYELPPNDLRYDFMIPPEVLALSGIPQNERK